MLEEIMRKRQRDKAVELMFPRLFEEEQRKKQRDKRIQEMPNVKALMGFTSATESR